MKQGKLFLSVIGIAMLLSFATTMTASAYDLQVSQQSDGSYWGTSPEGAQIGCYISATQYWDDNGEPYYDAPFNVSRIDRFKSLNGKNLTLPESVRVLGSTDYSSLIGQTFSITSAEIYPQDHTSGCKINVPVSYTDLSIRSEIKGSIVFNGAVPLNLAVYDPSSIRCIVSATDYDTYKQACNNNIKGWSNDIILVAADYRDKSHTVSVTEAGTLEDKLLALVNSKNETFDDVYNLTVTGNINGRDLNVLAKLKNLTTLDLSETKINSMRDCVNRYFLETVKLPNTVTEIEASAFLNCYNLKSVNLDKVQNIGYQAFQYANSLESIKGDSVKYIGPYAFRNCYSLKSIDFPSVTKIDYWAFGESGLEEFHIYDSIIYSNDCLYYSNVEKMYFHTNRNFNDVNNLPNLTDVYLYDPIPGNIDRDDSRGVIPRLHVPGFSFDSYIDHPNYYGFDKVLKLGDNLTNLNVYKDLNITSNESLVGKFDLTIKPDAYTALFENNASDQLIVGDFIQYYKFNSYWDGYNYTYGPSTTFINNGDVTADNVKVVMEMNGGWNFISFPYDVNISDIATPKEALWVIREYDGDIRAKRTDTGDNSQTESAWVNVTTPTLKARKGYILHFSSGFGSEFRFPAIDNENKNNIFSNGDVTIPLNYYNSEYPHNASWNLIGNPFDACFDSRQIKTDAPVITVWRDGTYEAFSIVEDNYVLAPFEAFFVQATGEKTSLTFPKEGRYHTYEAASAKRNAPRKASALNPDRAIINLHISGNGFSDRTRLVLNEEATTDYEIGRDASKFLSPDANVPQIYMIQSGQNLAINERPMGTGMFRLGSSFGVDGKYTISCDVRNSDNSVVLYDAETGVETDITDGSYEFIANAGVDNNRFSVRLKVGESGINDVQADNFNVTFNGGNLSVTADGEINVYTIDGKLVASGNDNLDIALSKGIYVVKAAGQTKKVTY